MSENKIDVESNQSDAKTSVATKLFEDCFNGECKSSTSSEPTVSPKEASKVSLALPELAITGQVSEAASKTGSLQRHPPCGVAPGVRPVDPIRDPGSIVRPPIEITPEPPHVGIIDPPIPIVRPRPIDIFPKPPRVGIDPIEIFPPRVGIEPPYWLPETRLDMSNPALVAAKLANEPEIGKAAFEKVQDLLKNKGREEAQKYIDQINKELEKDNSKFKLELKDSKFPARGPLGGEPGHPGSETTELRLVDKSKPSDTKGGPDETPRWLLKSTETNFFEDKNNPPKPDYPGYEKYESPSKRAERLANESAEEFAKTITETKSLDSIQKKLENSGDIEDQIKRINEILKKSGSSLRLDATEIPTPEGRLGRMFGPRYKVDLKDGEKTIQSKTIVDRQFMDLFLPVYRTHENKKD